MGCDVWCVYEQSSTVNSVYVEDINVNSTAMRC